MVSEHVTICLDNSSCASKAARPAPLTAMVSKKLFKNKAATSNQIDSDKTPQKEKAAFLHFGVLRKRIGLWGEK